jgi:alpha-ketoglutarate-dependent taurine dioxygenase
MTLENSEPDWGLPFVLDGRKLDLGADALVRAEADAVRDKLTEHGAVLLRGFDVPDVASFDRVVRAFSGEPLTYAERSSPRTTIEGQVYTSTEYPATEEIFLHNENSYQASWPQVLYFYCRQSPETLGATPLSDIRTVYELIDPAVRTEFEQRRWSVVRNYQSKFGLSWQYVFNTEDKQEAEAHCAANGLTAEWLPGERLRTRAIRDAVHRHPRTGVPVWFNHIAFFHISTVNEQDRAGLLELFSPDELPANTLYGDGAPIPDDVVAHLRDCYRAATTRFDWQEQDVLIVDNMAAAHGREPFTGKRSIGVAMGEAYTP